jgi:hypothetical protein
MIRRFCSTDPDRGYNTDEGGFAGHLQSEETRARISEAKKGVPCPEWILERMRSAPRRYVYTDEHRRRISESLKGHVISDETRALLREKGLNRGGKPVAQYLKDGTKVAVYPSVNEATRQTGIHSQSIGQTCLDKRRSAGGYVWRYE